MGNLAKLLKHNDVEGFLTRESGLLITHEGKRSLYHHLISSAFLHFVYVFFGVQYLYLRNSTTQHTHTECRLLYPRVYLTLPRE